MGKLQTFYSILDKFFISIWGLTVIDLLPVLNIGILDEVDGLIKLMMAAAGLTYFVVSIPHKLRMNKLERRLKEEELEKLVKENDKEEDIPGDA